MIISNNGNNEGGSIPMTDADIHHILEALDGLKAEADSLLGAEKEEPTEGSLMADLINQLKPEALQPWEYTYATFSEKAGISIPSVMRLVRKKVASGEFARSRKLLDERLTVVFWAVFDKPK